MPTVSSPLLREWDLLQEHVVPVLLDADRRRHRAQMWSVDSVADAVAVAAAYQHARSRESSDLRAYASDAGGDLSPVAFSLSDIRCVPARTRAVTFQREASRWLPGTQIAEQVILAPPDGPVDLVTLRDEVPGPARDQAIDQLRDGGHVLLVEAGPDLAAHRSLRPVGSSQRIFRKCHRGKPALSAGTGHGEETLAQHQVQADLVASHARLARSLARRFAHHGEAKDDLEQVALLALVKAARRYDPGRETSFSTYATASILGEIKRHFRDKTWMLRVPRSLQETYLAVKSAREELGQTLGASPTVQQIATHLGISDEAVLAAMEAGDSYWPASLDTPRRGDEDSVTEVPVIDGGFDSSIDRRQLRESLPRLDRREQLIVKRLYFDSWTQRRVAEEIGVSQMQVSRLMARTLEKLRVSFGEA